jgi:capping protein beta
LFFIEILEDTVEGKPFLKSEYNKDGDSYRSPWTNQYFPPIEFNEADDPDFQPIYPSPELLSLE